VALNGINDSWIKSKVAADRLQAVSPCVVGLDTFVGYDRPNKIKNALVAALRKQRALIRVLDETQKAQFDQMRMDRDKPVRPSLDAAGQGIEIENMVTGLLADILFTKL
jgi:hypothetical protein